MTSSNEQLVPVEQIDRDLRSAILSYLVDRLGEPCSVGDMPDDRNEEMDRIIARHRLAASRVGREVEVDLIERAQLIVPQSYKNWHYAAGQALAALRTPPADPVCWVNRRKSDGSIYWAQICDDEAQALDAGLTDHEPIPLYAGTTPAVEPDEGLGEKVEPSVAMKIVEHLNTRPSLDTLPASIRALKGGQGV